MYVHLRLTGRFVLAPHARRGHALQFPTVQHRTTSLDLACEKKKNHITNLAPKTLHVNQSKRRGQDETKSWTWTLVSGLENIQMNEYF